MLSIESIRKKIRNAEDLRDIVKTMRTLAAVNIHHYEQAVRSLSDYSRSVELGFRVVLEDSAASVQAQRRGKGGTYYIVFGTDQGLCGGFNDRIAEHALREMNRLRGDTSGDVLVCIGGRALSALEERNLEVFRVYSLPAALSAITFAVRQMVMSISDLRRSGLISGVVLLHHKLSSSSAFSPQSVPLLPIDRKWVRSAAEKKWPTHVLPAFTIERERLFSALFRQYVFVSLFRAFAESMASENAARLLAMQSAEKNIDERIEQFAALYRSERQTAITSELLDIVSGFEALRDEP